MTDLENKINSFKNDLNQIIFSLMAAYNIQDNRGVERIANIINKTVELLSHSIELNRKIGGDSFTRLNTLLIRIGRVMKNIVNNINNEVLLKKDFDELSNLHEQLKRL